MKERDSERDTETRGAVDRELIFPTLLIMRCEPATERGHADGIGAKGMGGRRGEGVKELGVQDKKVRGANVLTASRDFVFVSDRSLVTE